MNNLGVKIDYTLYFNEYIANPLLRLIECVTVFYNIL